MPSRLKRFLLVNSRIFRFGLTYRSCRLSDLFVSLLFFTFVDTAWERATHFATDGKVEVVFCSFVWCELRKADLVSRGIQMELYTDLYHCCRNTEVVNTVSQTGSFTFFRSMPFDFMFKVQKRSSTLATLYYDLKNLCRYIEATGSWHDRVFCFGISVWKKYSNKKMDSDAFSP